MTVQEFLKTLKTAKRPIGCSSLKHDQTPIKTLLNSACNTSFFQTHSSGTPISSLLSSLSSFQFHCFLSNPDVEAFDCLRVFNLVFHSQSELSFKPDVHAHFTLICRLIKSKMFDDAELVMEKLILGPKYRYPFHDFTCWIEKYCKESRIITKLLNLLLKLYSDHQMFDMANAAFEYMVENEIWVCKKTCSVHLYALVKSDMGDFAFDFFRRMVDSGVEIDVYSLTIVVRGLCKIGELKKARELVELMMIEKGIKPNFVTFNTLLDACFRRWEFEELDIVMRLMAKDIQLNERTYKLLIEGYSSSSKVDEAKKLLLEMQDKDFKTDKYLYFRVIKGYCRLGDTRSGLSLLRIMEESEIVPCSGTYESLVCGLCKVGEMEEVKKLVNELLIKGGKVSDVMFNALNGGYREVGMMDELENLKSMVKMDCRSEDESSQNFVDLESQA